MESVKAETVPPPSTERSADLLALGETLATPTPRFADLLRCAVPFRVDRGAVVAAPIDPVECSR